MDFRSVHAGKELGMIVTLKTAVKINGVSLNLRINLFKFIIIFFGDAR